MHHLYFKSRTGIVTSGWQAIYAVSKAQTQKSAKRGTTFYQGPAEDLSINSSNVVQNEGKRIHYIKRRWLEGNLKVFVPFAL
ncbi:hypothetical protein JTE90_015983 [Oedothorax gibbosus]|uniref:Uncharacterized protein n=1 Tax=Oedothorax gibbosus TaxID=931172 RepID=A0AAV6VQQ8_9ARAC|nr:hypothetical protein JTE90_015983 [Oedothorax gibbosus]